MGQVGAAIGAGLVLLWCSVKFAGEQQNMQQEIQKLQIALKGVTKNQEIFNKGLDVIARNI